MFFYQGSIKIRSRLPNRTQKHEDVLHTWKVDTCFSSTTILTKIPARPKERKITPSSSIKRTQLSSMSVSRHCFKYRILKISQIRGGKSPLHFLTSLFFVNLVKLCPHTKTWGRGNVMYTKSITATEYIRMSSACHNEVPSFISYLISLLSLKLQ